MSNQIITTLIDGGNIIGKVSGFTTARVQAEVERLEERVDTIITTPVEGVSAQEIIDARQGEVSLGANISEVKSQLAHIVKNNNGEMAPAITFIDDDVAPQVYTTLLPLAIEKNIPYGLAFINGHLNDMPLAKLKELQAAGFEILNHGTDVITDLLVVDDATAEIEIAKSAQWLKDNGFTHDIFVYSMGRVDSAKRKIISKYNRCAINIYDTRMQVNVPPINTYDITRVEFGRAGKDFAYYKEIIDETLEKNGWLVFEQHCWYEDFTADKVELTKQVVDYARSVGVDIISPSEGYERFKNAADVGISAVEEQVSDSYLIVGKNGEVRTSTNLRFTGGKVKEKMGYLKPNSDIAEFEKGTVTKARFFNDEISSYAEELPAIPQLSAGVLEVARDTMDDAFSHRFWHGYNQNDELYYSSYLKSSGTWGRLNPVFDKVLPDNTLTPQSTFDSGIYLNGRRFYCYVTGDNAKSFPFGSANGLVIVDCKSMGRTYSVVMEYHDVNLRNVFVRYYNLANNTWSKWKAIGDVHLVQDTITPTFNPTTANVLGVFKCVVTGANATAFGISDVGVVTVDTNFYDGSGFVISMEIMQRGQPSTRKSKYWIPSTSTWTEWRKSGGKSQRVETITKTIAAGATIYHFFTSPITLTFDSAVMVLLREGELPAGVIEHSTRVANSTSISTAFTNTTSNSVTFTLTFNVVAF